MKQEKKPGKINIGKLTDRPRLAKAPRRLTKDDRARVVPPLTRLHFAPVHVRIFAIEMTARSCEEGLVEFFLHGGSRHAKPGLQQFANRRHSQIAEAHFAGSFSASERVHHRGGHALLELVKSLLLRRLKRGANPRLNHSQERWIDPIRICRSGRHAAKDRR